MALLDIYHLRWRIEQGGVVMNNGIYFQQIDAFTGSWANGAQALVQTLVPGNENIVAFWQLFANAEAFLTCGIAEKVEDNSGGGDEQSILFGQNWTGTEVDALAPSQMWTFQLWSNPPTGFDTKWRNLYLGGLMEGLLFSNYVHPTQFNVAVANQQWILQPRFTATPVDPTFQAVMAYPTMDDIQGWAPITRVNPTAFLARKRSRRLALCV